jgi:hypothetical protein
MNKFSDFLSFLSVKYNLVSDNLIKDYNEFIKEEEKLIKASSQVVEDDYKNFIDKEEDRFEVPLSGIMGDYLVDEIVYLENDVKFERPWHITGINNGQIMITTDDNEGLTDGDITQFLLSQRRNESDFDLPNNGLLSHYAPHIEGQQRFKSMHLLAKSRRESRNKKEAQLRILSRIKEEKHINDK